LRRLNKLWYAGRSHFHQAVVDKCGSKQDAKEEYILVQQELTITETMSQLCVLRQMCKVHGMIADLTTEAEVLEDTRSDYPNHFIQEPCQKPTLNLLTFASFIGSHPYPGTMTFISEIKLIQSKIMKLSRLIIVY